MILTNNRLIGRYKNRVTNKIVNIHKGRNMQRGTDHYYYLYRGGKIMISDKDFFELYEKVNVT